MMMNHSSLNRFIGFSSSLVLVFLLFPIKVSSDQKSDNAQLDAGVKAFNSKDYATALKLWQPLADAGMAKAQTNLALMYYDGQGVQKNFAQAFALAKPAAIQGIKQSQYLTGLMYRDGYGVEQDSRKAYYWFMKAAAQGVPQAETQVCTMLSRGVGVAADPKKGMEWCERAAQQGDAEATREVQDLVSPYVSGSSTSVISVITTNAPVQGLMNMSPLASCERSFAILKEAADKGDAFSQFRITSCYQHGLGTTKDLAQAAYYLTKSAAQGYAGAESSLAECYMWGGLGVPKDDNQAIEWYRKAAAQGLAVAQQRLDGLLKRKAILDHDRESAKMGDAAAQTRVAFALLNGTGVQKDQKEAVKLFLASTQKGDPTAQSEMGELAEEGTVFPKNMKEAFSWYLKAANQGNAYAKYKVGRFYFDGTGVRRNYSQAFLWFQRGNNKTMMGECYEKGNGVRKDLKKAIELYREAAADPRDREAAADLARATTNETRTSTSASYQGVAEETPNQRRRRLIAEGKVPEIKVLHFQPLKVAGHIPKILSRKAGNLYPPPLPQSIDPVSLKRIPLNRPGLMFSPSPDGLSFAYLKRTSTSTYGSDLWISDTEGKEEVRVSTGIGLNPAAWSDDGKILLGFVETPGDEDCGDEGCSSDTIKDNSPIMAPGIYAIDISHGVTRLINSLMEDESSIIRQGTIVGFIRGTHSFVYREQHQLMRYDLDHDKISEYQTGVLFTNRREGNTAFLTNRSPWVLEPNSMIVTAEAYTSDNATGISRVEKSYIARFNLGLYSGPNPDESILVGPVTDGKAFQDLHMSPDGKRLAYLAKVKTVPPGVGEFNLIVLKMADGSTKSMGPCLNVRGWFGNDHLIRVVAPKDFNYGKLEDVNVIDGSSKTLAEDEFLVRYGAPAIF